MANENRASYFCIGLIVLLGAIALVGTLVYIGGLGKRGDELLVETYYDKPVGGLSLRSPVNFRGVKIGEVREIGFVGTHYDAEGLDNGRIYILMALDPVKAGGLRLKSADVRRNLERLVGKGLRATVSVNGITGIAKVDCDIHPDAAPPAKLSWHPQHLLIPPRPSLLENFSDSATKVMNQINKMDLNAFWSNVNSSVESISALTLSSRHLVESYQPEWDRMMKNLDEATSALRDFSEAIRRDPTALLRGHNLEALPETAR